MSAVTSREAVVELAGVSTGYEKRRSERAIVTTDIHATLRTGELTCLLGPNGAGKSTLMRTIAGMQAPLAGTITIDGRPVSGMSAKDLARVVSVVLTDRVVVGVLSAYALVALGRHPHTNWIGDLTDSDHHAIREAMVVTGAAEFADRLVSELSDGERQRVMVARALAQDPRIMVLDEITAFLDLPRRVEIMTVLRRLAHESNRAMLLSTHDLDLALRAADRIWLLPKHGALSIGAPEDLVLSGAFERAFAGEGVQFDAELGSFRMRTAPRGEIRVRGSGLARVWTVRALERAGYRVVDAGSSVCVVAENGAAPRWVIDAAAPTTCSSIEQLLETLAEMRPPGL
jgi:iron complex transport system ATP-binding protein